MIGTRDFAPGSAFDLVTGQRLIFEKIEVFHRNILLTSHL